MKLTKSLKGVLVGVMAATGLTIGGMAITAGASSTAYYACLASAGTLSHVGTTKPATAQCHSPSKIISWNSQGAAGVPGSNGATGPQGPAGAQGTAGATGATGPQGSPGDTNYDLAQQNGFEGSLSQWLSSLVGPQGATGPQGASGAQGATGPTGPSGATGATGPIGPSGVVATASVSPGSSPSLEPWGLSNFSSVTNIGTGEYCLVPNNSYLGAFALDVSVGAGIGAPAGIAYWWGVCDNNSGFAVYTVNLSGTLTNTIAFSVSEVP
jgi:Collagen triple helix repeat (20 copies)